MELALIALENPVAALDQVMYALSADAPLLGNLPQGHVTVHRVLVYAALMLCQQLAVEVK